MEVTFDLQLQKNPSHLLDLFHDMGLDQPRQPLALKVGNY